jgi:hypothetical protein
MSAAARAEAQRRFGRAAFRGQVHGLYDIPSAPDSLPHMESQIVSA